MAVFLGAFRSCPARPTTHANSLKRPCLDATSSPSRRRSPALRRKSGHAADPTGDLVVVRFEASDVEKSLRQIAESTDAFDVWFKQRVIEVAGVDLGAPSDDPPPEVILDWTP